MEYLISQYYDEETPVEEVIAKVKDVLNKHYILPEDKNKIKDRLKQDGSMIIIDKLSVEVDLSKNLYLGHIQTAGINNILVDDFFISQRSI